MERRFAVLVLAWVKDESTNDISKALGISYLIVAVFKTVIYLGYGLRPSMVNQYKFFGCCNVGLGDLMSMLGTPLLWQTLATVALTER